MDKLARRIAVAILVSCPLPALADANELTIFHSIDIDAPADEVWAMAGDFGGIQRWSPGTESSRLVLHNRNETGAIRLLRRRGDGTQVTEKLLDYDPYNRRMAYTYVDGVVRASDYYSELTVKEAGEGKSRVEWRGRFKRLAYWTDDPPPGQDDKAVLDFLNDAYVSGLAGLKKAIEAR
ncbi:MAG TPA: SRPBCC family protein [Burkholderiales bacterium]|nr:SRPBCC family protein [Burkholderiales bacterium]